MKSIWGIATTFGLFLLLSSAAKAEEAASTWHGQATFGLGSSGTGVGGVLRGGLQWSKAESSIEVGAFSLPRVKKDPDNNSEPTEATRFQAALQLPRISILS